MSILKSTQTGCYSKITHDLLEKMGFACEYNGHQYRYTKCPYILSKNVQLSMLYPQVLLNETENKNDIKLYFYRDNKKL